MKNWIEAIPYRRTLYLLFALIVFASTFVDIATEFSEGESIVEMFDDLAMLVVSAVIMGIFFVDFCFQHSAMKELQQQLENSRGRLAKLDENSVAIGNQYREVMQKQFNDWKLTTSEQEIVVLLLKGLSFREVAQLRNTTEKTVRQQASHVYRKSGVSGRHELAAWFFEDMLSPS